MVDLTKRICLIQGLDEEPYKLFRERIFGMLEAMQKNSGITTLRVVLTENKPPKISVIPFCRKKIASVSIKAGGEVNLDLLSQAEGFSGVYEVEEAVPVEYLKTWNNLEPTPGVNLLTLFRKKKSIDRTTFIRRWHQGHTPLSLKIHPLWNYNRNVVTSAIGASEPWDGIVEEHFKTAADLLNPARFFGDPWTMFYRMLEVYRDTRSFLDYSTIQTFLAMEYHIKTENSGLT
jgi:hypothetical protein